MSKLSVVMYQFDGEVAKPCGVIRGKSMKKALKLVNKELCEVDSSRVILRNGEMLIQYNYPNENGDSWEDGYCDITLVPVEYEE